MNTVICKICNKEAEQYPRMVDESDIICHYCGMYSIAGSFNIDSCFQDKSNFYKVSSWIREQNDEFNLSPKIDFSKFEQILNIKDKKIKEKFDLMMRYLSNNEINYNNIDKKMLVKCWIKNANELRNLFQKAIDSSFIEGQINRTYSEDSMPLFNKFTFDGLEYIENLDNVNQSSKNIFVAFNFENDLNEVFNVHLNKAITENGFNYVVVNQENVEHNKSINDEIIVKLKSSRIVIADFTNHRNSVYFEAGFAMGMNIPIIWTCQEGHEDSMSFDTRQFPHIIWKNKDDLVKQVIDRIKVIL
ncbi:MAG: hypothetical protein WC667_06220 [Sulfurimonas sp.]|jgi:nucleoside 2-deoxyribosyltransferase